MKITCPNCATTYALPDSAIGSDGRDVRCARCATTWFVRLGEERGVDVDEAINAIDAAAAAVAPAPKDPPPAEDETPDDPGLDMAAAVAMDSFAGPGAETPMEERGTGDEPGGFTDADWGLTEDDGIGGAEPDEAAQDDGSDDPVEPVRDIESVAQPRNIRKRRKRRTARRAAYVIAAKAIRARRYAGAAVFALAVVALTAVVTQREEIVRQLPDLGGLYKLVGLEVNLRGLEFQDVNTFRDFEDGNVVLVVEGRIANVSETDQTLPKIRIALRSAQGEEIYAWAVEPVAQTLSAGKTIEFRSRHPAPPTRARRVQVRFTDTIIGKTASR